MDEKNNNLEIDSLLGHYRILKKIGAGGMGEVYLAEDARLERRVALKILPATFAQDAERMRRFVQEAKAISALNHPNILTIYETGEVENTNYIASEYVEGETLSERLREPMSLKAALDVAAQIASALQAAHGAGIVHRDVKPDNVMIRPDGLAKLLDFGIAKLTEKKTESIDAEAATAIKAHTQTGTLIGTAAYMSPEQARGKTVDARSDIFSFGLVLYEMLSGKAAFAGENAMDVIGSILHKEPVPLGQILPDMPREIERIVGKALRKDCEERYQTAKDLLIDLKDVKQDLEFQNKLERTAAPHRTEAETQIINAATTDAAHTASSAEYIAGEIKNHKLGFVALSVLLLAAVGFGYWFYSNRSAVAAQIESIAVMPFVNASGNSDVEYLSDGMTESLINSLSQLPKLSVKARSSVFRYKGRDIEPQTVGSELSVQAILNGRVVERGDNLTLSLELVDTKTGNQIWGEQYNRKQTDLVALQNEIARDVANKLRTRLSGADEQKLAKNYTENAEAYQLYLKGRFYWYRFPAKEFEKSRDYYQQAIDVDPNYALAYAGLAEYYGFGAAVGFLPPTSENRSKMAAAVNKALALDDTLPDAYNALAGVKQSNNDRAGAEREFKRIIELNPNYAEGRRHYAMFLIEDGRSEETLAQMRKVLELEPLSVPFNRDLAMMFYRTRQYDRAIEQYRKTLELDPNDAYTHELLGDTYEQKGMQKEAVAEWSRALRLTGDNESATMLERTFAASGFNAAVRALWQKKLERFNEKAERGEYVPAMNYALAYTRLADKEQAFAWLAKAEQERSRLIYVIKLDPIYDSLRDDPRFQDLLRRVGLPQ